MSSRGMVASDNQWKPHVLADGNGDETARYAGIVAAAIGCFCLVLRARNGSCLGARPVIMSVAVPVETSTWGKMCSLRAPPGHSQ